MANLSVEKNNTKVIHVTLPAAYSATTATTTITVSQQEFVSSVLFTVTGTTVSGVTTFNLSASQNNISERVYFYTVRVASDVIATGGYSVEVMADDITTIIGETTNTNFYNKTQINSYSGQTAVSIASKAALSHSHSGYLSTGGTAVCATTAGNALCLNSLAASCYAQNCQLGTAASYAIWTGSTASYASVTPKLNTTLYLVTS
jgi:hypothetical protein